MNVVTIDHPDGAHAAGRPLPEPDVISEPFWSGAAEGRLMVQRCTACGHLQHYPRPMCVRCAAGVEWVEASGSGSVHTFTIIRQNLAPPLGDIGPYVVAMIELDEGPLMMSNVTHVEPADVAIGMRVSCYAVKLGDSLGIPFWRPA